MKVSDIVAEVRGRFFGSTTDADFTEPVIIGWIDAAQLEFVGRTKCLEEIGTTDLVNGVGDYDLPWNCLRVIRVQGSSGKIEESTLAEYDEWINDRIAYPSTCAKYIVWNDMIRLWPVPNEDVSAGLTLHYVRRPETLSDAGARPEIPPEYHEALSALATARAKMRDGELAEASMYEARFETIVRRFRSEKRKTFDSFAQVRNVE